MSDQPAFDFTRSHHRRNDPETSRVAAEMAVLLSNNHCRLIYEFLDGIHPRAATIEEIAAGIESLDKVAVARRMKDLSDTPEGVRPVVVAAGKKLLKSNRPGTLWKAAVWD